MSNKLTYLSSGKKPGFSGGSGVTPLIHGTSKTLSMFDIGEDNIIDSTIKMAITDTGIDFGVHFAILGDSPAVFNTALCDTCLYFGNTQYAGNYSISVHNGEFYLKKNIHTLYNPLSEEYEHLLLETGTAAQLAIIVDALVYMAQAPGGVQGGGADLKTVFFASPTVGFSINNLQNVTDGHFSASCNITPNAVDLDFTNEIFNVGVPLHLVISAFPPIAAMANQTILYSADYIDGETNYGATLAIFPECDVSQAPIVVNSYLPVLIKGQRYAVLLSNLEA